MSLRRPPDSKGRHRPTKSDSGNIRLYGRSQEVLSPAQRGEVTESGPIPPEIDWSELRAYICNSCKDHCLNWIESSCAQVNECRSCYQVRNVLLSTASEGEAARRDASPASGAIAPERPEGPTTSTRRKRTLSHWGPIRKFEYPLDSGEGEESMESKGPSADDRCRITR